MALKENKISELNFRIREMEEKIDADRLAKLRMEQVISELTQKHILLVEDMDKLTLGKPMIWVNVSNNFLNFHLFLFLGGSAHIWKI